jgi:hypothetical protein
MTDTLHLPAASDAPVACDMSTATDTPEERVAEYAQLFHRALVRSEAGPGVLTFWFTPDARADVDSLARREAACCPFADYRVETVGGEVVWTITTGQEAARR